jgi:uncharacterized protein (TIGR02231 family)
MTTLETSISDVTIYTDRARVTRYAKSKLSTGEQSVLITNLPNTLIENSVRVSGKGEGVKIIGVEVNKKFFTESPKEKISELEKNLQNLKDQELALADEDRVILSKINSLQQLQQTLSDSFAKSLSFGKNTIDNLDTTLSYLTSQFQSTYQTRQELLKKVRDLAKEIEVAQANLNKVGTGVSKTCWEVSIFLEIATETELELEVSYLVYGASWTPLYDVRLVENAVTLTYLASITQQTGEEWQEVKLWLSTARPAVNTTIPELSPWYLNIYIPPHPPMPKSAGFGARAMRLLQHNNNVERGASDDVFLEEEEDEFVPQQALAPAEIAVASVETSNSGASVTYRTPKSTNIPNDGSPHKTTIAIIPLEANLDYVTAPKLAEEAYLRAKIKNSSEYLLLPGTASIFHGMEFVGTTSLETTAPNEEFEVQLGIDSRIKVERKLSERTASKTFLGGSKRITFKYITTITNNANIPIKISIFDQLPIPYNEQIKVKGSEISPKPVEHDDLQIIKWELDFKAGEKREVHILFTVEFPKDNSVTGLE